MHGTEPELVFPTISPTPSPFFLQIGGTSHLVQPKHMDPTGEAYARACRRWPKVYAARMRKERLEREAQWHLESGGTGE